MKKFINASLKKSFTILFISLLFTTSPASLASLVLHIAHTTSSGVTTTATIFDQTQPDGDRLAPDSNTTAGVISTSIRTPSFRYASSSGTSKPFIQNGNGFAGLSLSQITLSSLTEGGVLTISLSDNNFTLRDLGRHYRFGASITGRLGTNPRNAVRAAYYYNTSNTLFDLDGATTLYSGVFSGGGGFSGHYSSANLSDINQPFSITQRIQISVQPGMQIASFESNAFVAVPLPATLPILGIGLLGLICAIGKSKQRKTT